MLTQFPEVYVPYQACMPCFVENFKIIKYLLQISYIAASPHEATYDR